MMECSKINTIKIIRHQTRARRVPQLTSVVESAVSSFPGGSRRSLGLRFRVRYIFPREVAS
jgi:hypothetical protein